MFFFEKQNQKTFANWARSILRGRSQHRQKFFASFFQEGRPFFKREGRRSQGNEPLLDSSIHV
jgi:hypothetical protein